jgi:predicted  nucleic acid-binding Zn-ribbon protein
MHPTINALLELHQTNLQRQRLIAQRQGRETTSSKADAALNKAKEAVTTAQAEVDRNDALLRQYTTDVERCDEQMTSLRGRQMEAKTNKEYLEIINGIESAKAEKALRQESLNNLNGQIEGLKEAVTAAEAHLAKVQEAYDKHIYQEQRQAVDSKFLEVYERLIKSRHKTPLLPVDGATRATPFGRIISHNDAEKLRLGNLVIDTGTNAILYIKGD